MTGTNVNNLKYADDRTLKAGSEEKLKSLLMKVKEESEKAGLKFNMKKLTSWPLVPSLSWQIDKEKVEEVTEFIFLGSRITADCDCSYEIKRCLLLVIKVMTHLDNILKSKDITFVTKAHLGKAMVFSAVMYGCQSWTIKKAEH